MPKQIYVAKDFKPKTLKVIAQANEIIAQYDSALTLRQLYYRFVAAGLIPNKQTEYSRLGAIINDGRLAGLIDWNAIEDRGRQLLSFRTYASPADAIRAMTRQYNIDLWRDQDFRCEVWVEKQALESVVESAADEYQVPTFACKGYTSQSELWRAARRFARYERAGQTPVVIHLGDHDPSGIDMTRDIQDRLHMFGMVMEVNRIALNMDQVEEHEPPPNPAKQTDSRFQGYVDEYGDESWELDALEPPVLTALIHQAIKKYLDQDKYDERVAIRDGEQARLEEAADNLEEEMED